MELIAPTTFDARLLRELRRHPVRAVYGSLPHEPSMRPANWLPDVAEADAARHIRSARAGGIGFSWAINASCLGNREFTGPGQQWLLSRLQWLQEAGAEGVTTASPYIVELVKRRFPGLSVTVSVVAQVDTLEKARFFEDLGADRLYVPPDCNRDLRFLKALRRAVRCELAILVNEGCLLHCPLRHYHANFTSHSAESLDGGFYLDYCLLHCTRRKLADPVELIKSPWVRPEDLGTYENLGYNLFKLAGRDKPVAWIARAIRAYAARRYDGDFGDLVGGFEGLAPRVQLDNRTLDGFLAGFARRDCRRGCGECTYCARWAGTAVRGRPAAADGTQDVNLERLVSGSMRFGAEPAAARRGGTSDPPPPRPQARSVR